MAAGAVYRRSVVAALALAGAVLFIVAGLGAAARRVHVGGLDAQALAEKLAVPHPVSALDWPELRVRAVVPQPGRPLVVVLLAGRPGFDEQTSTLLARLDDDGTPVALLSRWCADGASVAPRRLEGPAPGEQAAGERAWAERGGRQEGGRSWFGRERRAAPPPEPGAGQRLGAGGGRHAAAAGSAPWARRPAGAGLDADPAGGTAGAGRRAGRAGRPHRAGAHPAAATGRADRLGHHRARAARGRRAGTDRGPVRAGRRAGDRAASRPPAGRASALAPGQKMLVWYDPANPDDVLTYGRGGRRSDWTFLAAGLLASIARAGARDRPVSSRGVRITHS